MDVTQSLDITQSLKDAENTLRDFIAAVLGAKRGAWLEHTGVSPERIAQWNERKEIETKRQEAGVVEERLLYYADFYDLKTILEKNWQDFAPALGKWKRMEVWLEELERMRDPDAHRRELLPHQKHLILGISGEIRNRIVRYRSKQEVAEDYFPRLESVRDSLGNIWTAERYRTIFDTQTVLRPGDVIDFVVTASDPLGEQLGYGTRIANRGLVQLAWQDSGTFSLRIEEGDIARSFFVELLINSSREHHAASTGDDSITFMYQVLPAKRERY